MTKNQIVLVHFIVWSLLFSYFAFLKPKDNFDTIFYVASALAYENKDNNDLHNKTYGIISGAISKQHFLDITQGTKPRNASYRKALFDDAEVFANQLPFYQPRVAYSGLIYGLYKLGLSPVYAIRLIAGLSCIAGVWFFLLLVKPYFYPVWLPIVVPWLAAAWGLFDLARLSTPDALVFFVTSLFFFGMIRSRSWVMYLLPLLVLIRTDLILLIPLVLIFLYRQGRPIRTLLLILLVSLAVMQVANANFNNYGWYTTIMVTFISQVPHPGDLQQDFSLSFYAEIWRREFVSSMLTDDRFLVFLMLASVQFLSSFSTLRKPFLDLNGLERIQFLSCLGALYVLIHILLFPASWERFFMAQYVLILLGVLMGLSGFSGGLKAKPVSTQ